MKTRILILLVCTLFATVSFASTSMNSPVAKFLIEIGADYGGDEIAKVFFTDGSSQAMRAGQGLTIAVGCEFQFPGLNFLMLRSSIGLKYSTTAADNANIMLTRLPINVIPFIKIKEDFRVGAGITTHQNIRLKGDGFLPNSSFTSGIGPRFELGYKWIALTYSAISYTRNDNMAFSGSSAGVSLSYTWP